MESLEKISNTSLQSRFLRAEGAVKALEELEDGLLRKHHFTETALSGTEQMKLAQYRTQRQQATNEHSVLWSEMRRRGLAEGYR